jgi:hypothetical protein
MGVLTCNRMMDQMQLEEVQQTLEKLLKMETDIVELHRYLMVND